MKIVLLGYMACGKTFIASKLAKKMNIRHIDLDAYIEMEESKTIAEIFKSKGEIYFRNSENKNLKKLLESDNDFILSVGGGTPCYANNMELILNHSNSFYLKANIDTLYERLQSEKESRPMVSFLKDDDLKEFIAKHLFERNQFYLKSNYIITTDAQNHHDITKMIEDKLAN